MTQEGFKRKLTAILSADAVGYSRLMGENEEATVRTITSYRDILFTLIQQHNGNVLDSPGDNLLAEFASVVDAVQCAVAVQKEIQSRNDDLPEDRRMQFRIGINIGDVIQEKGRIYGDGVNIAARLEGLSDPGGICISKSAFDQIESKLPYGYEFLGDQPVKNITKPIGAYRVLIKSTDTHEKKQSPASLKNMAFPLPDKPSIAVLPFKNISGDSEQEFLADGITESLIGAISRVSGLFVIASNSVFTYKGKAVKVQRVSEELGVRNILEGTVQRIGNQLRVNAQLIDALKGWHLWSEKYDRKMQDLFLVQDNISKEVLTILQVKLVQGEQARVWAKGTKNLDAYIKYLQAYDYFKSFNKNELALTRQICEEAIAIDPNYELPHALLGTTHLIDIWFNWGDSLQLSIEKANLYLEKAIALNPDSDFTNACLSHLYLLQKRFDEAVATGKKSITLNPNGDLAMVLLGITFNHIRRYEEAIKLFREAQRRSPYCPAWYIHNMAWPYLWLGKLDEAIEISKRSLKRSPDHLPGLVALAAVYGAADRIDEGRAVGEKILNLDPDFTPDTVMAWPNKFKADVEVIRDGLRKVVIPVE
jgi:adenylate cyclase